jgi:hypothetical protein
MLQAGKSPLLVSDEADFFNWPNTSSRTQHLTKMSARNHSGVKSGRRVGLTTLSPSMSPMSENVAASTFRNHKGLHGLYRDTFFFFFAFICIA